MSKIIRLVPLQFTFVPDVPEEEQHPDYGTCTGCLFKDEPCKSVRAAMGFTGLPDCMAADGVYQLVKG